MKKLLIVYHSQGGTTERLAQAVLSGARRECGVSARLLRAFDAGVDDLLECDGLILGSPENLGYMAGAIKDFFDRTFYPAEGKTEGLPYGLFVKAGNDGRNTVTQIERIATGYRWRRVVDPIIVRGSIREEDERACADLGEALAAGLALGVF
jgi:multimeric flavodoxin WrbA